MNSDYEELMKWLMGFHRGEIVQAYTPFDENNATWHDCVTVRAIAGAFGAYRTMRFKPKKQWTAEERFVAIKKALERNLDCPPSTIDGWMLSTDTIRDFAWLTADKLNEKYPA